MYLKKKIFNDIIIIIIIKLIRVYSGSQITNDQNYKDIPNFREQLDDYLEFAQSLMNNEGKPVGAPMYF